MGTVVRLYLGWRLFRLLRPLLAAALIAGVVLTLRAGTHAHVNRSAASAIERGAAAAGRDLSRALQHAFQPGPSRR